MKIGTLRKLIADLDDNDDIVCYPNNPGGDGVVVQLDQFTDINDINAPFVDTIFEACGPDDPTKPDPDDHGNVYLLSEMESECGCNARKALILALKAHVW
jgi:hypothetical protein